MSLPREGREQAIYLLRVAGLAAAYYGLGKVGLSLAVPPGYATVIWPPSGIALAALLAYKPKVWPGIFFGSLLLNAHISGVIEPEGHLAFEQLPPAVCIALGATLQALLTRLLIHNAFGSPITLRGWRDLVWLFFLAAPMGCMLAPTVGVTSLYAFGKLSTGDMVFNWLTWWKGDTLGVIMFLPLALILPGSSNRVRWRDHYLEPLPPLAILALMIPLGLTLYTMQAMIRFNAEKTAVQFHSLAEEGEKALIHRMRSFSQALQGGAGFLLGSSYVTREEWRVYERTVDVSRNYPGMNGIGWIADVPDSELQAFVERMRREGAPDFGVFPRSQADGNFIVSYVEPERPNQPPIGLNIAFEPIRYEAATRARDTGRPAITRRIRLVNEDSGEAGFLFLWPLYQPNRPVQTQEQRRAAFRGWIFTPLIGKQFLAELTSSLGDTLNVKLYDGEESPGRLIYASSATREIREPRFQVREALEMGQSTWLLVWESTLAFEAQSARYEPLLVLAGGLLVTGLFGGFLMVVTRRAETIQQVVRERTHQLQRSQDALKASEETFRYAMEHAPIGMALVDPAGRFLTVNQALCSLLGYDYAELCRTDFQTITHPDDLNIDLSYVRETLEGLRKSYELEKRYFAKDGRIIWALLRVSLVRTADGTPRYFIAQIQDVTQRRQMDRMKTEFISTVSHELRTPLTSIRGSLGLIASGVLGQLPEKLVSLIRIAHNNSERLVRIINDILDIEKIGSGKLELNIHAVSLVATLRQALEVNEPYGARFQVKFELDPVPEHLEVMADPDRLVQVLTNLLSNAAKFSPPGSLVIVRAHAIGASVRIEVEDHGTGIPEEFRSRIFEKFAQADASSSRRFEGTGLGLSISRQLVEAMGGKIDFTTTMGRGTTFYFHLPLATAMAPKLKLSDSAIMRANISETGVAQVRENEAKPCVLHVENDVDLQNMIEAALSSHATVLPARTIREAQKRLRESRFSLVVLDLSLPDGDGVDLLEQIATHSPAPVPVVILSATETPREVQQRVAAALVKSRISEAHAIEIILSLLKRGAADAGAEPQPMYTRRELQR